MTIQHAPLRAPRHDMPEAIFVAEWRKRNLSEPTLFGRILNRSKPSQRDAQVAASFVSWLGTGVGDAFLIQARQRLTQGSEDFAEGAFVTTWALTNRRKINGLRMVEYILSRDTDWELQLHQKDLKTDYVQVSLRDMDVIESLVIWLSTSEGGAFLKDCASLNELEISRRRREFMLCENA